MAARNCLVAAGAQVKIGDFGMSRLVISEEDYYRAKYVEYTATTR